MEYRYQIADENGILKKEKITDEKDGQLVTEEFLYGELIESRVANEEEAAAWEAQQEEFDVDRRLQAALEKVTALQQEINIILDLREQDE